MTADVLSLDGARVSARHRVDFPSEVIDIQPVLDRLARQVDRTAVEMFGDLSLARYVYVTYEIVAVMPEPAPAA